MNPSTITAYSGMSRVFLFYRPLCLVVLLIFLTTWILKLDSSSTRDTRSKTAYREQDYSMLTFPDYLFQNPQLQTSALQQISTSTLKSKKVYLWDLNSRFCPKTLGTCADECLCEDTLREARTVDDWEKALKEGRLKGRALFKSNEYMFPWEENYLSKPPLNDTNNLPDLTLSSVWFLSQGKIPIAQKFVNGKMYERLSFRVDLVDGHGKQRPLGGDEIRAWISEDPSTKSGRRFSASGYVRDLGNGSYIVTVTPVWTGLTNLNIGVVYPREYIRAALHHARVGSNRFIFGLFKHTDLGVEEVTVCHATPNIPGRACVCNFTSMNQVPFYCGRPLDKRLTCLDWVSVWPASQPPFKDLTPAESEMASRMSRPANETLIKHGLVITIVNENAEDPSLPPCTQVDRRVTWDRQSPRGFWTKGPAWTSLMCQEPVLTPQWTRKCLKSTHVWLIGDSNIVRIRSVLCSLLECTYHPRLTKWPDSLRGRNEKHNITVFFEPHEQPLYLRLEWMSLYMNGGMENYLSHLPSTGRHIVIIHYFLHLASSHLSALYYRLVSLREALLVLFIRNPEIIVGIRGPHISTVQWTTNHMFGGDVLATFMIRMFYDVFGDLKDHVIFLDGWDMSISIRNAQLHPSNSIPKAMLRTLLSFKCPS